MSGPAFSPQPQPQKTPPPVATPTPQATPTPAAVPKTIPAVAPAASTPGPAPWAGSPATIGAGRLSPWLAPMMPLGPLGPMYGGPQLGPKLGPQLGPQLGPTPTPTPTPTTTPQVGTTPAQGQQVTPSPNQPAPDVTPQKQIDPKAVADAAAALRKETDGHWFANPASVISQLRGKSPEEIAAIKKEYQDHYGQSLDSTLVGNLGGKEKAEAAALLSGDPVKAAVEGLKASQQDNLFGKKADGAAITQIMNGISDPKIRQQVMEQFQKDTGQSVGDFVKDRFSGDQQSKMLADVDGNKAKGAAAELSMSMHSGFLGMSTDKDAIFNKLQQFKDPKDRATLIAEFKNLTGQDLNVQLGDRLSGLDKDAAQAMVGGDYAKASAIQIQAGSQDHGFLGLGGPDKDRMYKQLEGKSPEERQAIISAYDATFNKGQAGGLNQTLDKELKGDDREKAKQLVDQGKVNDELQIKMAMNTGLFGWFSDDKKINQVLAGKSKEEIADLEKKYQGLTGQSLKDELAKNTGGDSGFEIQQNLKGKPTTPEEMVERANEYYAHQRSNPLRNMFIDTFGGEAGRDLDRSNQRLNTTYTDAKKQNGGGDLSPDQKKTLEKISDWQGQDYSAYQERKDSVTNGAAQVASIAAGVALTVATAGMGSPVLAAALVAGGSGAAMMGTKALIKGDGYGGNELKGDIVDTGFNIIGSMGAAQVMQFMKTPGMDKFTHKLAGLDPLKMQEELSKFEALRLAMAKTGTESLLKGEVSQLTSRKNWEGGIDDVLKGMLVNAPVDALKDVGGTLASGLPGVVGEKVSDKWGQMKGNSPFLQNASSKFNNFTNAVGDKWDGVKDTAGEKWDALKAKIPFLNKPGDDTQKEGGLPWGQILGGVKDGTLGGIKKTATDGIKDTLSDANTWGHGFDGFAGSLYGHTMPNLQANMLSGGLTGGKDAFMKSDYMEDMLRDKLHLPDVDPSAKPGDKNKNLTPQQLQQLEIYRGGFGGLIDGGIKTVTDPTSYQSGGNFLENLLKNEFKSTAGGIQGGSQKASGIVDDRKAALKIKTLNSIERMRNSPKPKLPGGTPTPEVHAEDAHDHEEAPPERVFPNSPLESDADVFEHLSH